MSGTVHASAVALDGAGVLIRGASGAGKSTLARALVADFAARGRFARLVADDRVALDPRGERLIARVPPRLAGLVEVRGVGIVPVRHLAAVRLSLVVSLVPDAPRYPEEEGATVLLAGVAVAALCLSHHSVPASVLAVAAVLGSDGLTTATPQTQRPAT